MFSLYKRQTVHYSLAECNNYTDTERIIFLHKARIISYVKLNEGNHHNIFRADLGCTNLHAMLSIGWYCVRYLSSCHYLLYEALCSVKGPCNEAPQHATKVFFFIFKKKTKLKQMEEQIKQKPTLLMKQDAHTHAHIYRQE